jgi:phage terminase large subunit-like protein
MQGENLKRELMSNPMVKELFGPMKSDTFSKDMWVTANGVAVMPRGSGQQVRGILHGNNRPGLIIVDDLEDSESVRSEEQRAKQKEWFFADVLNSVDRAGDYRVIFIGTLLHEDSLLANLMEDPNWYHVRIALCNEKFESNWPEFMSNEDVLKLADSFRKQGLIDTFYREYMGLMTAGENKDFTGAMFRGYNEDDEDFLEKRKGLESVVIMDPAKTTGKSSADTAIVGLGFDYKTPRVYFRDLVYGKLHPHDMYDELFNMALRLGARVIGVEVTSLNEFITYPLKTEMIRRGLHFEIVELKARSEKEERIRAMRPFYRLGFVYHNNQVRGPLEAQLLSFPHSKKLDIMDAMAYFVELLEMGERYFLPGDDVADVQEIEDEYKAIENEPAMDNWRII